MDYKNMENKKEEEIEQLMIKETIYKTTLRMTNEEWDRRKNMIKSQEFYKRRILN